MSDLKTSTPAATYKSLLKIDGVNQEIDGTLRSITDGTGNATGLTISTGGELKATSISLDTLSAKSTTIEISDNVSFEGSTFVLTDTAFSGTGSSTITAPNLNISNWDTAYGWGNHAGLYPVVEDYNNANWDTAYGWGDHSAEIDGDITTHAAIAGAHHIKYALTEDLASTEITAIQNINTKTITNTQWGYLGGMGGQPLESFSESDPVFLAHQANNISAQNITDLGNLDAGNTTGCSGDQVLPTDFVSAASGGTFAGKAESTGHFRVLNASDIYPTSGQGLELMVNAGTGNIINYDRDGSGYYPLNYHAKHHTWNIDSTYNVMKINGASATLGQITIGQYGAGTITGTATKWLAVDSGGNIIEESPPSGAGLNIGAWDHDTTATNAYFISDGVSKNTNTNCAGTLTWGEGAGYGNGGNPEVNNSVFIGKASGHYVAESETGCEDNTFIGAVAGWRIRGDGNTGVGKNVMKDCQYSTACVAIGEGSMGATGWANSPDKATAVGAFSLSQVSSGSKLVAVGYKALANLGGGTELTAVGYEALMTESSSGGRNTAVGAFSLKLNNGGNDNTAIGAEALQTNSQTGNNTAIGSETLENYDGGNFAAGNTAVGNKAGRTLTSGKYNTFLGYNTVVANGVDNQTAIGSHASTSATGVNTMMMGGPNMTDIYMGDDGNAWTQVSDGRLKRNIEDWDIGLDVINGMRIRQFQFNEDNPHGFDSEKVRQGVIGQEVLDVFPEMMREGGDWLSVNNEPLVWALVNAVKELSTKIELLESK